MSEATEAERALAERRMREINESWAVLQDPQRRRAYDEERVGAARRRPSTARPGPAPAARAAVAEDDDDLVDVLPPMGGVMAGLLRHLPWVVALVVLGGIFLLSAYAGSGGDAEAPTTPTVPVSHIGECLDLEPGPSTTIVPCDGPHEFEIVTTADRAEDCPAGTEARRFATNGRFDCVQPG